MTWVDVELWPSNALPRAVPRLVFLMAANFVGVSNEVELSESRTRLSCRSFGAMASLVASSSSLCCASSTFYTSRQVKSAAASTSSSVSVCRLPAIVCGRGDKRTAKGKRARGSFGNCRSKDSSKGTGLAITPLPPLPKKDDSVDTEYIHVDIDESLFTKS